MAWFPIARALIKMSYANLPASMGTPRADLEWTLPRAILISGGSGERFADRFGLAATENR
jgi:hypothetical protein